MPTRSMGTIGVLEVSDRYHALRGNAAQDAQRPLSNATRSMGMIGVLETPDRSYAPAW